MNPSESQKAQIDYWDRAASSKVFTHPLHWSAIHQHFNAQSVLLDYGCGYGRLVQELQQARYFNIIGADPSAEMVNRGLASGLSLRQAFAPSALALPARSLDGILLFAVLTCIPDWEDQVALIRELSDLLRRGGKIYVSDYYMQDSYIALNRYEPADDPVQFGAFSHSEGVRMRHHSRAWIRNLFREWNVVEEWEVSVRTMNGNEAVAFQLIAEFRH